MKSIGIYIALLMVVLSLLSVDANPQPFDSRIETAHFAVMWKGSDATMVEAKQAAELAEAIRIKLADYLGTDRIPKKKIRIVLGGSGIDRKTGNVNAPYVSREGVIYIYRFPTGYFGELAHEMIHAFRLEIGFSDDMFLEEGLAEAVASLVFPKNVGFARYGFPMTVAAGVWSGDEYRIPLFKLRRNHAELNMKCQAQSYTLRADFFEYLIRRFGKTRLLEFAYAPGARELTAYEKHFQKPFAELEADWLKDLRTRIAGRSDYQKLAADYLQKTGVRFMKKCRTGVDY